jgi:phosphate transport system protein
VEAAFLIRTAIDSFVDADTSLAAALDDIDDRLDDLQVSYVEAIFESHQEDRLSLRGAVQLALIGRYFERVGDHAVNIGERVIYMVTGWLPESNAAARNALRSATSEVDAVEGGTAGGGAAPGGGEEPRGQGPATPGAADEPPDPS